ncbi:MAG TPA: methyltransferase [Puia sp.]|nr:methyltransferase [Puia sp.]
MLIFSTGDFHFSILSCSFIISAVILAGWAIAAMQRSRFRVSPIPAKNGSLVKSGPYKFIRHPMYASILLAGIGLLLVNFSWQRLLMVIFLLLVLLIKLGWEEKMLTIQFPEYPIYKSQSKRLIPFLF